MNFVNMFSSIYFTQKKKLQASVDLIFIEKSLSHGIPCLQILTQFNI